MTRYEKHAWFNLIVLAVTLVAFFCLGGASGMRSASAAFGLLGLWGFGPLFFLIKRRPSEVITDERDEIIKKTASQQAFGVFWLFFVGACMSIWALNLKSGSVNVDAFPLLVISGWMVFILTHATSTIIQYRKRITDATV